MLCLFSVFLMGIIPLTNTNTTSTSHDNSLMLNDPNGAALAASTFAEPAGRANLMMAYDNESDVVIIYGGWNEPLPYELGDTWSYDYNTNKFVDMSPASAPPVREVGAMAYDSQSDRIVMFGGIEDYATRLDRNDTWAYDYNTNTWTNMNPILAPDVRDAFGMVYDSESDRIIIFGGYDSAHHVTLNDTWAYDLESNTWEEMNPATAPSERYFPGMAYDEESDRVILFGGVFQGGLGDDTWAYDYNTDTWVELSPGTNPVGRKAHAMTYDDESDRVVMFGGAGGNSLALDDIWTFDFNSLTWERKYSSYQPTARLRHSMVYDSESDVIISFGGTEVTYENGPMIDDDVTWAYDMNANHWRQMSPITQTEGNEVMMAFDSESNMTIIFGGRDMTPSVRLSKMDTWAYDASTDSYFNMSPIVTPAIKSMGDMVYDSQSDVCVMFGGLEDPMAATPTAETWLYDFNSNTWTNASPSAAPPVRYVNRMAYDSKSDRTILFGGYDGSLLLGDTWAYDVESNTWEEMSPTLSPDGRVDHMMTYDWESDRVILFGGQTTISLGQTNDTWAYDYDTDTWQEMSPTTAPPSRAITSMAYDNESDTIVLFGGFGESGVNLDDTWLYDYNSDTWTQATPSTHPSARFRHKAVYDSKSDTVIIFGGINGAWNGPDNDISTDTTWSYDVNTDTWTKMSEIPEPSLPPTTTTTTPTSPTSPTEPSQLPLELIAIVVGGIVIVVLAVIVVRARR